MMMMRLEQVEQRGSDKQSYHSEQGKEQMASKIILPQAQAKLSAGNTRKPRQR